MCGVVLTHHELQASFIVFPIFQEVIMSDDLVRTQSYYLLRDFDRDDATSKKKKQRQTKKTDPNKSEPFSDQLEADHPPRDRHSTAVVDNGNT